MDSQISLCNWGNKLRSNESVKSNHTQYSSIYSTKSNSGKYSNTNYRPPSVSGTDTLISNVQSSSLQPRNSSNIFSWLFYNIRNLFYKKRTRIFTNEQCESPIESNIENSIIDTNCVEWKDRERLGKYIIDLTSRFKSNKDLYKITKQIRNFTSLDNADVDNIMNFNKDEILIIILLQNYCLEHYREHIEEMCASS
jgi:hypothetical protein